MKNIILIILVVLLAIGTFLYMQSKNSLAILTKDLHKQEQAIEKYQKEAQMSPGPEAINKLEEANKLGEKDLKKARSIFDSQGKDLPIEVSDKGIYFFESLYATNKLLERKATAKKMVLPSINFSVEIPQETDIPFLLKQIEMIEQVTGIIIDIGNCEIESVAPVPLDINTKILDFNKLRMQATVKIDANSFIKVISELNNHLPLYLIEELSVKSLEDGRLRVNLIISRIITGLSLADIAEFNNKDIKDLNAIFPLQLDSKLPSTRNPFVKYVKVTAQGPGSTQAKPGVVSSPGPQFTYKGSINMSGKIVGIIKDNWQDNTCFSSEGDICSEYKVLTVKDKEIKLSKDGQEIILMKGAENE